jgi:carbamoyltransferase
MYLGIVPSHDGQHHDPSACLIDGGEILAFVEEERMSRNKHAVGEFPINAIEECLHLGGADLTDIEEIGLSRNYDNRRKILGRLAKRAIRSDIGLAEKLWDTVMLPVKQTATMTNSSLRSVVINRLTEHFSVAKDDVPRISCLNHQLTHAASAFYPSGFDKGLVVSLDNYGGHLSGAVYTGNENGIEELESFLRFNSLGRFYGDITEFLGFQRSNGEGKVMGLAPYGEQNDHVKRVIESYINFEDEAYDTESLTFRKTGDAVSKLEADLGIDARYWRDEITQAHKDVAFHAQQALEDVTTELVSHYISEVDTGNVCLAGGVALNCKLNKQIRNLPEVNDIFVQPAANDAGGSLGAAIALSRDDGNEIQEMKHVYLGSEFNEEEIRDTLERLKLSYSTIDDVPKTIADLLSNGEIVGWFQGRMESGPRALGNRSILADPRSIDSRDNVNKYVKHREEWRPFAPSMLYEEAERYLKGSVSKAAYFMIDTYETTPKAVDDIPAALHPRDNTTRPQVVTRERNERYYELLQELKEKTGIGVVLNTSFNDSGEPIVRTPREAVRDFYSMGMDALVIEDILIRKSQSETNHSVTE